MQTLKHGRKQIMMMIMGGVNYTELSWWKGLHRALFTTKPLVPALNMCVINYVVIAVGCEVSICDFHREQAWERWTSATKNGVAETSLREGLLARLRRIANAPTVDAFNVAVNDLKQCSIWRSNAALQRWFSNTWLKEHKVSNIQGIHLIPVVFEN